MLRGATLLSLIGSVAATSAVCDVLNPLLPDSLGCSCEATASGFGATATCSQGTPSVDLGVFTLPAFTVEVGTELLPCGEPLGSLPQVTAHVNVASDGQEVVKVEEVVEVDDGWFSGTSYTPTSIDLPVYSYGDYTVLIKVLVYAEARQDGSCVIDCPYVTIDLYTKVDVCASYKSDEYCGADLNDLVYGYDLSALLGSPPWVLFELDLDVADLCAEAVANAAAADKPCFARDSFAIGANGEPVAMASLRSGDVVMDGPDSYTRIIVNQHAAVSITSSLLRIGTADATISVTPDHVIEVDGNKFAAARTVGVGSKLGEQEVVRVTSAKGEIINPLTASGKILTQGGILATTYPEWVADYMLASSLFPLPFSLSNALSYLFPTTTQAFYDGVVESFVTAHHPVYLKAALPAPLIPAAFALGDLSLVVGFVAFSLASPMALVAVAAVVASQASKARK